MARLPIDDLKDELLARLSEGPVVISAPTGSGKSTQVPRWCPGPVLVVEPRRVACRSLAARVAELEGTEMGKAVGYHVRDEPRFDASTRILFVTPGIALREHDRWDRFHTIIVDEFHERTLDVDLLFALLRARAGRWVVMSATLEADRIADAIGGVHLQATGRTHPVDIRHTEDGPAFPTSQYLTDRVAKSIERLERPAGDVLVFLPGKAEIAQVARKLGQRSDRYVCPLHGSMPLSEQAKVFASADRTKIILTTNVAETSVTVPGVRVVIDSGLVRQTRYFQGMGALALVPIARDSAEQRAGRAGRTAPGTCYRLWKSHAHLKDRTLPEIHRESLVPLVLGSLACGHHPETLPFLDRPKEHALEAALEELRHLGAVDTEARLTEQGQALFQMPLDPALGRLLVEARHHERLDDVVDLVSMLAVARPLFSDPKETLEDGDPREMGCDAVAAIRALRSEARDGPLSRIVWQEAREHRRRLRKVMGLSGAPPASPSIDRDRLLELVVAADRRRVYVARHRGRRVAWANGGTEIELDRRSALELVTRDGHTKLPEAMVVLGIRAMTDGPSVRIIATQASPITKGRMLSLGLGRERLAGVKKPKKGRIYVEVERVYAGKVLGSQEVEPTGALLREAVCELIRTGRLFPKLREQLKDRLTAASLLVRLVRADLFSAHEDEIAGLEVSSGDVDTYLAERLMTIGLEAPEDLELIEPEDFLPEPVPEYLRERLDREYPRTVDMGDAKYEVRYDLVRRQAELVLVRGQRRTPPQRQYLPRLGGLTIVVQAGGTFHRLR